MNLNNGISKKKQKKVKNTRNAWVQTQYFRILEKLKFVHDFYKKICKTFFNHTQHVISSPNEIEFDHKICCFRFLTKRGGIRKYA